MLKELIEESLRSFYLDIQSKWVFGKEREVVSIFALDHLLPLAIEKGIVERNSQIAIESRVPQFKVTGQKNKSEVCKDLAIWGKPFQNCWIEQSVSKEYPIAIMEFKAGTSKNLFQYDLDWLFKYTKLNPSYVGVAINVNFKSKIIQAAFVKDGIEVSRILIDK